MQQDWASGTLKEVPFWQNDNLNITKAFWSR